VRFRFGDKGAAGVITASPKAKVRGPFAEFDEVARREDPMTAASLGGTSSQHVCWTAGWLTARKICRAGPDRARLAVFVYQ
jgi:hypothetical protein